MTDLRVNTDIMRSGAGTAASSGDHVAQVANKIGSLNSQVPNSYNGQLRDKVGPILSGAASEGMRVQGQAGQFSADLNSLAAEIDAVMQKSEEALEAALGLTVFTSALGKFFSQAGLAMTEAAAVVMTWIGLHKMVPTTSPTKPVPGPAPSAPAAPAGTKSATAVMNAASAMSKPISPVKYEYGVSGDFPRYGSGQLHAGMDILPPPGEKGDIPIHPIGPGVVIKVGEAGPNDGGYGNYIVVEHTLSDGKKVYSLYAHLAEKPDFTNGDKVSVDTVLGDMGSTGHATGRHLHLQIMKNSHLSKDFSTVDPNAKVDPKDTNSLTWEQKMRQEVYSPHDVLNGQGEAQDWTFLAPK